jgi:hypothetical protein
VYTVETSHSVTARLGFLAHEYGWGALGFPETYKAIWERIGKYDMMTEFKFEIVFVEVRGKEDQTH